MKYYFYFLLLFNIRFMWADFLFTEAALNSTWLMCILLCIALYFPLLNKVQLDLVFLLTLFISPLYPCLELDMAVQRGSCSFTGNVHQLFMCKYKHLSSFIHSTLQYTKLRERPYGDHGVKCSRAQWWRSWIVISLTLQ